MLFVRSSSQISTTYYKVIFNINRKNLLGSAVFVMLNPSTTCKTVKYTMKYGSMPSFSMSVNMQVEYWPSKAFW